MSTGISVQIKYRYWIYTLLNIYTANYTMLHYTLIQQLYQCSYLYYITYNCCVVKSILLEPLVGILLLSYKEILVIRSIRS